MSSKHTPGPWKWETDEWGQVTCLLGGDGNVVLDGGIIYPNSPNGRLVAAAPELLEACKALVQHAQSPDEPLNYLFAVKTARAAVAKAEGGAE